MGWVELDSCDGLDFFFFKTHYGGLDKKNLPNSIHAHPYKATSNCKLRKDQNKEAMEDASEDWERLLDLLLSIKTIVIKTITT